MCLCAPLLARPHMRRSCPAAVQCAAAHCEICQEDNPQACEFCLDGYYKTEIGACLEVRWGALHAAFILQTAWKPLAPQPAVAATCFQAVLLAALQAVPQR